MMKSKGTYPAILLLILTAASCNIQPTRTVIGHGDPEDQEILLDPFSGVNVVGTCKVVLSTGEEQSVWVSAQPQIHEALSYKVTDSILHIGVRPDYNIHTDQDIRATIVVPDFSFAGITGEGSFHLSGETQENLDIQISGSGEVEAFGMEVENCNILINGVGNCNVNVSSFLEVIVSGTGYVLYMGNPEVESHILGVGQVSPVDE